MRLSCVVDDFYKRIFRNLRPSRERESAAGFQNPSRFGHRTLRVCEMKEREVRNHAIKDFVRKRKILRVALAKFDSGKHFLRNRDHLRGEVETGRECAAFGRSGRHVTGTATDIQDRHLPGNFGGVEQRRNELASRARPGGIVFVRDTLPAFMLEFGKGIFHYLKEE